MEKKGNSKFKIWIEAIRLRTLPLSIAGITAGAALAYRLEAFNWNIFIPAITTTLLLQILSNLANDYGDAQKGTDGAERIGPKRMVASGMLKASEILSGIYLVAGLSLFSGTYLLYEAFGYTMFNYALSFFVVGVVAIWAAIKYTVGTNAYGYYGFGDLFVLIFFGFISVAGSYMLFTKELSISAILQSLAVGSFSVGVLHLNNMRDRISDEKNHKRTMAVKLGFERSKIYFYLIILIGISCSVLDLSLTALHFTELIHSVTFIPLIIICLKVAAIKDPSAFNNYLKPVALSTFFYALLLFLSFVL